jgi:hypothetical protein
MLNFIDFKTALFDIQSNLPEQSPPNNNHLSMGNNLIQQLPIQTLLLLDHLFQTATNVIISKIILDSLVLRKIKLFLVEID